MEPAVEEVILLEGSDNYESWSRQMKQMLKNEGLWKTAVNVNADTIVNPEQLERAMALIALHVEKKNYKLIRDCISAKEMWNCLKLSYEVNSYSLETGLLRYLCNICLTDCESVHDYFQKMTTTVQQLNETGFVVNDRLFAGFLLKGLPEEWNYFVKSLESSENKLTALEVKSKILKEAQSRERLIKNSDRRTIQFGHYKNECPERSKAKFMKHQVNHLTLFAQHYPGKGLEKVKSTGTKIKRCWKCRKLDHLCRECPMKRQNKGNVVCLDPSHMNKAKSVSFRCWKCHKNGHLCRECPLKTKNKRFLIEDTQTTGGNYKYVASKKEQYEQGTSFVLQSSQIVKSAVPKDEEKASRDLKVVNPSFSCRSKECSGHDCYYKVERSLHAEADWSKQVQPIDIDMTSVIEMVKEGLNVKFDKNGCHVYSPEGKLLRQGKLNNGECQLIQVP